MSGIAMRFNGRKITSTSQLQHELMRSIEKQVENNLKKAAGPSVGMKKTGESYTFEGIPE